MRSKIQIRLTSEETAIVNRFCEEVGVDRNTVAKKALFMVMQQAYRQAEELAKHKESNDVSRSQDAGRDMESVSVNSQDIDSTLPAEQTQV